MSQSQTTAGSLGADKSLIRTLDRAVKQVEESIRSVKQRWRVRVFARAAAALAKRWVPEGANTKVLIIPDCYGRLANRLTVLANAIAYAKVNDAIVVDLALRKTLKADCLDAQYQFGGCLVFAESLPQQSLATKLLIRILRRNAKEVARLSFKEPRTRIHGIPLMRGEHPNRIELDRFPAQFADDRCVVLTGVHVDAVPPSDAVIDDMRELIRPNREAQAFVQNTLAKLDDDRVTVGVHVRHGDYRVWQDGLHFHTFEEYVECMKIMRDSLGTDVTFLVVSDEEQDLSCCAGVDVQRIYGTEEQDLALLGACDYLIATHSSFANWASFHGRVPILTVRDALKVAKSADNPTETHGDRVDVGQLNVVEFPTLRSDYIV